jgi:predicted dehydrogenase
MTRDLLVAVIGFGSWGEKLTRAIRSVDGARLSAIVETDNARRALAAITYPDTPTHGKSESLTDVDAAAVVIATPPETHFDLAYSALSAGHHVFVAKPLALTTRDARALAVLAKRTGQYLMVGHTFLFSMAFSELCDRITSGQLGEISELESEQLAPGRIRPDVDALWNLAPHDVSQFLALSLGVPKTVTARRRFARLHKLAVEYSASYEFDSALHVTIHVSCDHPRRIRAFTVRGERGWLCLSFRPQISLVGHVDGIAVVRREILEPEPLLVELGWFVRGCDGSVPRVSSAEYGVAVVKILEATSRSAERDGSPVSISPSDPTFEENAMWRRPSTTELWSIAKEVDSDATKGASLQHESPRKARR